LLSAENARTGNVWRWFMRNTEMLGALDKIGLVKYKTGARSAALPANESIYEYSALRLQ